MESQETKRAIDTDFLRDVVANDAEFKKELLEIFSENAAKNINKMQAAIDAEDKDAWYMASHSFKGASASIGAFDLSKKLEYAQKHPEENAEEKTRTLGEVKAELELVSQFIEKEKNK